MNTDIHSKQIAKIALRTTNISFFFQSRLRCEWNWMSGINLFKRKWDECTNWRVHVRDWLVQIKGINFHEEYKCEHTSTEHTYEISIAAWNDVEQSRFVQKKNQWKHSSEEYLSRFDLMTVGWMLAYFWFVYTYDQIPQCRLIGLWICSVWWFEFSNIWCSMCEFCVCVNGVTQKLLTVLHSDTKQTRNTR